MKLLALIFLLFLPGCLTMISDIPDPETDMENRPPKIVDNLVYPPEAESVTLLNSNCESYNFYAYARDPDRDTLYYRVFVNYYLVPTIYDEGAILGSTLNSAGQGQIMFQLSRQNNINFEVAESQGYNFAVVELLVVDRPFDDGDDVRAASFPAQQDRLTWTVVFRDLGPCYD